MLSILIPVYNQDITKLVYDLHRMGTDSNIPFEIRIYDDGSHELYKKINNKISKLEKVVYYELSSNVGRAEIRNKLGHEAQYDLLLFLDGDSGVVHKNFIEQYLSRSDDVIFGGRIYQAKRPAAPYVLHWEYGRRKESLSLKERINDPTLNFQSNNFLIKKSIFNNHPFDVKLDGYGYEDLVFADQLTSNGITISHIDNPTIHLGLETNQIFLEKQLSAIWNLVQFQKRGILKDTRMTKVYHQLNKLKMIKITKSILKYIEKYLMRNLLSPYPSIRALQSYKLFHYIMQKEKIESEES